MILLKTKNLFSEKIGKGNGIRRADFEKFCARNSGLVKTVFKRSLSPGYGFLGLPDDLDLVKRTCKFSASQKKYKWKNIVVLGIGGSALGLIAIREALLGAMHNLTKTPRLFVMDNIDPVSTAELLEFLNFKETLFIVISKSGTTVEPMALYALALEKLKKICGKSYRQHLVFITDPVSGILRRIAKKEGIEAFDVPSNVGGRFSVLSAVGLLPAALAGVDITGILKGAKQMRETIKKTGTKTNPALILAAAQYLFSKKLGKSMTVMMPYADRLCSFCDWYRQLLAESIGKNKTTGPTPINALGTTDQHSQLQLYMEGPDNKLFLFLRNTGPEKDLKIGTFLPTELGFLNGKKLSQIMGAAHFGTSESLAKNGRPNLTIEINGLNAESLGALFMLFEFQVAILGLMYKVNAFDQPGVEQSKTLTKKILSSH